MEERAPLDRQSLQHTSKEPEAQMWAQIGTPQYNPPVPQTQAEQQTNEVKSPLESYKIPKLGSSSTTEESAKSSGDVRDEESDEELQVDENAETVLADVEPTEASGNKEMVESTDEKTPQKKEEANSGKEVKKPDKTDGKLGEDEDPTPYTSSNDPKLIKARVFVGQLDTSKVSKKDVEKVFEPFGKLLGVLLLNGYGFVQYEDEECAKKAIKDAHGTEICGSKIVCDRPLALKQLLRDERRVRSGSPEAVRRRERELLEELDYLRRREYDRFSRLEDLDRLYYPNTRPPFRDPYYEYPFERSLPPPPMDRYERLRMEELERARARDRYPPHPPRSGLYDRPRDDPFEERRHFHRDPYDHYDLPPPYRRY